MRRKFKMNKLRELHAALGALIAESDATAEDGPADPHQRNRSPSDPMNHPEPQANDAALSGERTLSMAEAFPGYNRIRAI